jgi:hypothetical protein
MENNTEIFAKKLIRHVCETKVSGESAERDAALREAFHNCMVEWIKRIREEKKKEVAFNMFPRQQDEDLKSFVGALGHAAAHAAASQVASGLGVSTSTVMKLGGALLKPSKQPTTRMLPSKQPTAKKAAKKKKIKTKSATGKSRPRRQLNKMKLERTDLLKQGEE